ncbi:MAG: ABC transporter substrate-binding protein, partial [Chloroflexota bacterium]
MRENPNIKIEYEVAPAYNEYKTKLMAAGAAGNLPDLGTVDSFWAPYFAQVGYLQPLEELWSEKDRSDYMPFTIKGVTYKNHIYGVWINTDVRLLYYRKSYYKEAGLDPNNPPRTLAELREYAKKLTRKGHWGFGFAAGRGESLLNESTWPFFWSGGGEIVDDDGNPKVLEGKNRELLKKIFSTYYDMIHNDKSVPKDVLNYTQLSAIEPEIWAGKFAQFIGGSWHMAKFKRYMPDDWQDWGYAPVPRLSEKDKLATSAGGFVWAIFTKDPKKQAAAWKFIEYYNRPEHIIDYVKYDNQLPVRKSNSNDPFFSSDPFMSFCVKQLDNGHTRPGGPLYAVISDRIAVAAGEYFIQTKSLEDALDDAKKAIEQEWQRIQGQ